MRPDYKEELAQDPHHSLPPQQGTVAQRLHLQRPSSAVHSQPYPDSPHHHPTGFPSPHSSNQSVPLQHHSPFTQAGPGPNGQAAPEVYYPGSPYGTPVSGQYTSAVTETSEMMATHMPQRSYPVYHTPQSNSPASVASSQSHDHHGRTYSQAPQMTSQMYANYTQYPTINQAPAYPQHPAPQQQQQQQQQQQPPPQHQMMTSQPSLSHQQSQPPMPHQQPSAQGPGMTNSPRTQPKLEPPMPRPLDPSPLQRTSTVPLNSNHSSPPGPSQNGNGVPVGHQGGPGNPLAAPGPIPATTPLVVRQDNNGVQWIAFEYSRDRVKMEYTIRCDVESVNADALDKNFKDENCVYPRACCEQGQYKGNRLQYETECNTVGWSLAELNPCLRTKRGLIQRAVDSWRNSNQDSRLRSRRVRRLNKINTRKERGVGHASHATQLAGPAPNGVANPMATPTQPQRLPPPSNASMAGPTQIHHHHANQDGGASGNTEGVSVNGDYDRAAAQAHQNNSLAQARPSNVLHGYANYPLHPTNALPSCPPHMQTSIEAQFSIHPNTTIPASSSMATVMTTPISATKTEFSSPSPKKQHRELIPGLPANLTKRKFIMVDDNERGPNGPKRVRLKVDLESVALDEIPDSFRQKNSVYPRSFFPSQMQMSSKEKRERRVEGRFIVDEDDEGFEGTGLAIGRTMVKAPVLNGEDQELPVPKLGKRIGEREERLNEVGYKISWTQGRHFADRVLILQRSLNAFRDKLIAEVPNGTPIPITSPLFETRPGKKRWAAQARRRRTASP